MMIETYKGWAIEPGYVGYTGTHPDYEAWTEGEGEWADNGLSVHGMTVDEVKAEIDDREDERNA